MLLLACLVLHSLRFSDDSQLQIVSIEDAIRHKWTTAVHLPIRVILIFLVLTCNEYWQMYMLHTF